MDALKRVFASPYLLLPLTMLFWAGNNVVGRAAAPDIGPMALSFWRWLLALCILLPFVLPRLREQRHIIRAHWARLFGFGVLGVAAFTTLHYTALGHTTAINASLLASTMPAAIIGVSWLLFRETVSLRATLGMAVALAGVIAIVAKADTDIARTFDFNDGDLLALLAVVIWALYSVLLRFRPRGLDPLAFLAAIIASGLVVIGPLYAIEVARGLTFVPDWSTVLTIGYVGVFPSLMSYVFYNAGVEALGANKAGQFIYLSPLFASVLAVTLLGERFQTYHAAGMAAIFVGLYLSTGGRAARGARGAP